LLEAFDQNNGAKHISKLTSYFASRSERTAGRRAAGEVALRRRLQRAKREGDLPKKADPAELARYVMTVLQGMAVQGADGASPDQLRRVAQVALRAWPKR
jgi:hypothetical protein